MKRSLFNRISDIISVNFQSLIESIENGQHDSTLKRTINEVETVIDSVRDELAKVVTKKHLVNKEIVKKNNNMEQLSKQIELALSEDRSDLAKTAISKVLDIEDQLPILEKSFHDSKEEIENLESYLNALRAKTKEMRDEYFAFKEEERVSQGHTSSYSESERIVEKAETQFEDALNISSNFSLQKKRDNIEEKKKLQELESLEREHRIKERLKKISSTKK